MKILDTIKTKIFDICGIVLMIPIIFYLDFYELKPLYTPK